MSLSKIVSNLRSKIKEQEVKNQSLSARLDTVMKEKDQFKLKYNQLQKEQKLRGGRGPHMESMHNNYSASRSAAPVQSRINTNLKGSMVQTPSSEEKKTETFTGFASASAPRVQPTKSGVS